MFHLPLLVLSLVIATLYSALFHLLWGRTLKQLFIYWLAAIVGFGIGQVVASACSSVNCTFWLHRLPAGL